MTQLNTEKDLEDACLALIQWFHSQGLDQTEAMAVMGPVVAGCVESWPDEIQRERFNAWIAAVRKNIA